MHTDGWCKGRADPQVKGESPRHPACPGAVTGYTYLTAPTSPHFPTFKATLTSTLRTKTTDVCFFFNPPLTTRNNPKPREPGRHWPAAQSSGRRGQGRARAGARPSLWTGRTAATMPVTAAAAAAAEQARAGAALCPLHDRLGQAPCLLQGGRCYHYPDLTDGNTEAQTGSVQELWCRPGAADCGAVCPAGLCSEHLTSRQRRLRKHVFGADFSPWGGEEN